MALRRADSGVPAYVRSLEARGLSAATKRAYRQSVHEYAAYLSTRATDRGDPLSEQSAAAAAVVDFKRYLKSERGRSPRTINLALAAIDSFYRHLGLPAPQVARERLEQQTPTTLTEVQIRRWLQTLEHCDSDRDRALLAMLFYATLRVREAAQLNVRDVRITSRSGDVRAGSAKRQRQVPLNAQARTLIAPWHTHRQHTAASERPEPALFTNRNGGRLSERSIETIVARHGATAGLSITPHVLRDTGVAVLLQAGNELALVADIAGHRLLDTTRRYMEPSSHDRVGAMDSLAIEH